MDTATVAALLKSYGAPDTPENANRIRQHYASDPTAADRRLYGAQGQSDESGGSRDAILNAMLDKFIAQTAPAPVAEPPPQQVMPTVQNASTPSRKSATAGQPLSKDVPGASVYDQRNLGPLPPKDSKPAATSGYEVDPQTSAQSGSVSADNWMMDLLAPIIGILGAGALAGKALKTPQAKVDAAGRPVVGPTSEIDPTIKAIADQPSPYRGTEGDTQGFPPPKQKDKGPTPAQRAAAQAEFDAANIEGEALQREMAKQARASRPAKKPLPKNAVRNVTGRK